MTTPNHTNNGFHRLRLVRPAAYLLGIAVPAAAIPALAFGTRAGTRTWLQLVR